MVNRGTCEGVDRVEVEDGTRPAGLGLSRTARLPNQSDIRGMGNEYVDAGTDMRVPKRLKLRPFPYPPIPTLFFHMAAIVKIIKVKGLSKTQPCASLTVRLRQCHL